MGTTAKTLMDMERRFWQSMVDEDSDTATHMLTEPAVMVSSHGAMKFDHAGYRNMANKAPMVLTSFELSDMDVMFPNRDTAIVTYKVKQGMAKRGESNAVMQEMNDSSTWIHTGDGWRCVMHTETPVEATKRPH